MRLYKKKTSFDRCLFFIVTDITEKNIYLFHTLIEPFEWLTRLTSQEFKSERNRVMYQKDSANQATCTNSFKCIFMIMGMITGLLISTMAIG